MLRSSMKAKSETAARELIKVNKNVVKYGLLRKRSSKALLETWPFRFVVLLKDSLHVYQDENAYSPSSVLEFDDYNQVTETSSRSYDCCFSVLSKYKSGSASSRKKTFSCFVETEMKEWIDAIRRAMNPEVKNTVNTDEVLVGNLYRDDNEYSVIGDVHIRRDGDEQAPLISEGKSRSFRNTFSVTAETPMTESVRRLHCNSLPIDSTMSSEPPPRPSVRPKPRDVIASVSSGKFQRRSPPEPPQDVSPYNPESAVVIKTRPLELINLDSESKHIYDHIDLVNDESLILESIYSAYKFTPPNGKSTLLGDCTIPDQFPDRDKCIVLLKSTREPGTYLVRNSRQGKQRVLATLSERGEVVEYIIYQEGSKVTINHSSYFGSLEELLEHYSARQIEKGTGEHLKKGIHLVMRSRQPKV